MMSAGVHSRLTDTQEPDRTGTHFALLQEVLNNLSLMKGLQRLHLLTSAYRKLIMLFLSVHGNYYIINECSYISLIDHILE